VKLRIQANSLRLRVSQSELARFVETGLLEETIHLGPGLGSELTYRLVRDSFVENLDIQASPGQVQVLVPAALARSWSGSDRVGMEAEVSLGTRGKLSLLVEKDFACIERSEIENADAFPNPRLSLAC
jgi:hypothetical protein